MSVVLVIITFYFAAPISLPEHYQVADYILTNYNKGYIPKRLQNESIKVSFSMELYQIIQVVRHSLTKSLINKFRMSHNNLLCSIPG